MAYTRQDACLPAGFGQFVLLLHPSTKGSGKGRGHQGEIRMAAKASGTQAVLSASVEPDPYPYIQRVTAILILAFAQIR